MTNFMALSDVEVVEFIDRNFHLFAKERSEDFPSKHLRSLASGGTIIIRREEGFAMVRLGRDYPFTIGAELMFLYVLPEYQGGGIGTQLVEQVKTAVKRSIPVELTCETQQRCRLFERSDFTVKNYHEQYDLYEMVWIPE